MAVTKIWPVKGRLDSVIRYAENEEKTRIPDLTGLQNDLEQTLNYAANDAKTTRENQLFVSGVNCVPAIARQQMELTKQQFGKTGGTVAFHAYQSFPPGEVTPEQCHAIGVELAKRLWGDRFQVLVATHLNTDCCHNHFVLNSVSFADGKRYNDCKATYRALQQASDRLCREHGLSVVEPGGTHTPRNIYQAEKQGEPTRYNIMRTDIDQALFHCRTFGDLPGALRQMGYEVRFDPHRTYATLKLPGDKRAVRFKTLGEDYAEDVLRRRIAEIRRLSYGERQAYQQDVIRSAGYTYRARPHRIKDLWDILTESGDLFRYYRYYRYLFHHDTPGSGKNPPPHPVMWEEYRRWDKLEEELRLMEQHALSTPEAVERFAKEKQAELNALATQRDICRNRLRRYKDPVEADRLYTARNTLSDRIAAIRKDLRIVSRILPRIETMRQKLELFAGLDQKERAEEGREW